MIVLRPAQPLIEPVNLVKNRYPRAYWENRTPSMTVQGKLSSFPRWPSPSGNLAVRFFKWLKRFFVLALGLDSTLRHCDEYVRSYLVSMGGAHIELLSNRSREELETVYFNLKTLESEVIARHNKEAKVFGPFKRFVVVPSFQDVISKLGTYLNISSTAVIRRIRIDPTGLPNPDPGNYGTIHAVLWRLACHRSYYESIEGQLQQGEAGNFPGESKERFSERVRLQHQLIRAINKMRDPKDHVTVSMADLRGLRRTINTLYLQTPDYFNIPRQGGGDFGELLAFILSRMEHRGGHSFPLVEPIWDYSYPGRPIHVDSEYQSARQSLRRELAVQLVLHRSGSLLELIEGAKASYTAFTGIINGVWVGDLPYFMAISALKQVNMVSLVKGLLIY